MYPSKEKDNEVTIEPDLFTCFAGSVAQAGGRRLKFGNAHKDDNYG